MSHLPAEQTAGIANAVRLVVRDSGPGVDLEDEELIFDPFFTRRVGGSGLGLAVVQRAVKAHHGAVLVGNHSGGGAEFVLYLPGGDRSEVVATDTAEQEVPT